MGATPYDVYTNKCEIQFEAILNRLPVYKHTFPFIVIQPPIHLPYVELAPVHGLFFVCGRCCFVVGASGGHLGQTSRPHQGSICLEVTADDAQLSSARCHEPRGACCFQPKFFPQQAGPACGARRPAPSTHNLQRMYWARLLPHLEPLGFATNAQDNSEHRLGRAIAIGGRSTNALAQ